jgi:hypothetical protein
VSSARRPPLHRREAWVFEAPMLSRTRRRTSARKRFGAQDAADI